MCMEEARKAVKVENSPPSTKRPIECVCPEDFECTVCCDLLLDPVVAPCGHDMCLHCYLRWSQESSNACPLCRSPLPSDLGICLRLKRTIENVCGERAVAKRRADVMIQEGKDGSRRICGKGRSGVYNWNPADLPTYPHSPVALHELSSLWTASSYVSHVCGQHLHYLWAMMPLYSNLCHASSVEMPTPMAVPLCSGNSAQSSTGERSCLTWQSAVDRSDRLNVAKAIISIFHRSGIGCSLGTKLPDAVRLLELMLYRTAPTKEAYLDELSLDRRVVAAIQERASAATKRRLRLHCNPM
ncbi:hypothetical protein CEUSTIGMA_g11410.t1 [Chlamydomonas eustigma]|uniref:RING-type domain-containing protein n=1 Tax=Chlamydomonas eustigma TaxID=1157962 RepID=A0A250XLK2_9CHLO|nr:hypothetical protein CEUSTIGMA_g11410.t1 [Chlamydomonas eustigma]|eukprot:GAX83985.1 hypothetical protein CEUSTIGMA_g11410.t1 [Chlamydomonas eustigma]